MTPILQQFQSESRDFLQGIGEKLIQLEKSPDDSGLMGELFRFVHTLKGNSGLFEFPEMTRALHAAEDLMVVVRDGGLAYSQTLADRLLETMDFVGMLLDEIALSGEISATHAGASATLAQSLRQLIPKSSGAEPASVSVPAAATSTASLPWIDVPEVLRLAWHQRAADAGPLSWVTYTPESECFFKGEDPFFQARQTPQILWRKIQATTAWPSLPELDAYHCALKFHLISSAPHAALAEHFRYVPEQIQITTVLPAMLEPPRSAAVDGAGGGAAQQSRDRVDTVLSSQIAVLSLPDDVLWLPGRLKAVAATLSACYRSLGQDAELASLDAALASALQLASAKPLLGWLNANLPHRGSDAATRAKVSAVARGPESTEAPPPAAPTETKSGRRNEDTSPALRTLKVDQDKIDRLMNLIGEMVVAKNGLPYLAGRAENVFGVRELAREIKSHYAVINRVAEEMQSAIMQVRMMPVSFVFQRFPRLVRDISRKLGKEVELVLEGEETEADKNIIEALADPLIHIVRNSLDHGIETPEVRQASGKPAAGRLVIRASQEADRVVIDISDDGKGIDPGVIKRKAYEKGIIDETVLERITDQDAVNLVFAAGFSTAEVVSDLSGRGVGMDVVRTAVERVNGTVALESSVGRGTRLRLSLPLSMAITNVIIIESGQQIFGVPMEMVIETVRVKRSAIHTLKNHQTTVLRERIVPLRNLNELLATHSPQTPNSEDEYATLVIRMHGEAIGIVVDDFREVVDIILKPMTGILGDLPGYAGSALLGDGSVLIVLNPKELV